MVNEKGKALAFPSLLVAPCRSRAVGAYSAAAATGSTLT